MFSRSLHTGNTLLEGSDTFESYKIFDSLIDTIMNAVLNPLGWGRRWRDGGWWWLPECLEVFDKDLIESVC